MPTRSACASISARLSCICSKEDRWDVLTPAYSKLVEDDCVDTKGRAYLLLGAFLTTFAEPQILHVAYDPENLYKAELLDEDGDFVQ